jgi:hypothetical protein
LFPSLSSLLVSSFFRNHSTRLQTLEKEPKLSPSSWGVLPKYKRQVRSKSTKSNKIAEGKKKFNYTNKKNTHTNPTRQPQKQQQEEGAEEETQNKSKWGAERKKVSKYGGRFTDTRSFRVEKKLLNLQEKIYSSPTTEAMVDNVGGRRRRRRGGGGRRRRRRRKKRK